MTITNTHRLSVGTHTYTHDTNTRMKTPHMTTLTHTLYEHKVKHLLHVTGHSRKNTDSQIRLKNINTRTNPSTQA